MKSKNTIKILMTTDTVGGVWTYTIELCQSLQAYQVEVYLVSLGRKCGEEQKKQLDRIQNVHLIETDYMLEWMKNPWKEIDESGKWLLRLEQVIKPDLVHLNCYAYGSLPFKAPVIVVAHSDVYSWFLSVIKEDPGGEWLEYFWRVKRGLESADLVVAPSQSILHQLKQVYSPRFNSRVIYNARGFGSFAPRKKEPYLFSMGRIWDKAKNIQLLTKAAEKISFEIRIAGEQDFSENYFSPSFSDINYLGKLETPQVSRQLANASVFVLPAKYEPFGLSILEAALSGCALVLGNIDSLKEIWGDSALYVDTDDADALAGLLNKLMNSREEIDHYSRKALARAMRYSTEAQAEKYWQVYSQFVLTGKQLPETV
jgi:glycogen synthase